MSSTIYSGIAAIAGTANQCLLARRAGFSVGENVIYNTASTVTTYLSLVFFVRERNTRPIHKAVKKEQLLDKIKEERMPRDFVIAVLASHVLG